MTPYQKVKHAILQKAWEWESRAIIPEVTVDNIDQLYRDEEELWDAIEEVREGQVETDIKCEYSRHYESKSVASLMPDGTWVGWTFWYGGGKHGEPSAIDWMSDAYDLNCVEEEKLVIVRTFTVA